jgi:hypothetical protein
LGLLERALKGVVIGFDVDEGAASGDAGVSFGPDKAPLTLSFPVGCFLTSVPSAAAHGELPTTVMIARIVAVTRFIATSSLIGFISRLRQHSWA